MSKHFIGSFGKYTRKKSHDLMLWEDSNNSNDTSQSQALSEHKVTGCQKLILWFVADSIIFFQTHCEKAKEKSSLSSVTIKGTVHPKHKYSVIIYSPCNFERVRLFIFCGQKKNSEQCSGGCFLFNYNKKGLKLQEGQETTLRYHKIGLYKSCAIFQVFRSLCVRNTEMKVHWKSR